MDNLKYYNDSLAYDFDMFMPKSTRPEDFDNIVKLPVANKRQDVRRRSAAKTVSVSALAVMTAFFVLAALCGNIFLRLQINEVNTQINDMKTELNVLDSEKTGLQVEFERRISYSNIELEAAEMGMKKMDKEQVRYIRVNNKNVAKTDEGEKVSELE